MAGNDGSLKFDTKIDSSGFEKGLDSIGSAAQKGLSVTAKVLEGATTGITALAGAAVKVGSDFEAACSQIAVTMGVTTDEISGLVAKAEELGSTTAFSATEAAQGLNILAMSGLTAEEQMAAIGDVLNLAAAGSLSLESAAAYTTGTVKGFADSMDNAQKYVDMIAKGATLANTDVNGLGEALSSSAATAKSYGQEADGVTLSLLRLAEQNVTGAEAATALNRAMMDVYTPTDSAKKALDALGISAYDSSGRAREFNVIVDELNGALSGMSDEEANAAKNAIFTSYGLQAFNKMTVSSTEKIEGFKDGLAHASDGIGSAAQQAETMLDNLQGQLTILQSGLEGLGVSMYETMQDTAKGVVKEAQGMVQQLQDAFNEGGFAGLVGSVGNVLAQIVQRIADAAPMVIDAAVSLVTSFCDGLKSAPGIGESGAKLITSLVTGLMSCVGEIWTTAVVLFAELLAGLASQLPRMLEAGSAAVSQFVQALVENAPSIASSAVSIMSTLFSGLMSALPQIASAGTDILNKLSEGIANNLPSMIPAAMSALAEFSGSLRENVGLLVDAGLNLIMTLAQSLIDNMPVFIETIPTIITNIAGIINDNAPKLLTSGIELIGKLAAGLIKAIPTLISNIPQIIEAIVSVFTAFNWVSLGTNIINFITNGIKSLATSIPNAIKNIGQTAIDWLKAINWRTLGADIIDLIVMGVQSLLTAVPEALKSIGLMAAEFFKGIDWIDLGINLIKGIVAGITGALDGLWSAVGDLCSGVLDSIKGFFGIHSPSTVMAEQGDYLVQGLVNGIANMPAELAAYLDQAVEKVIAWGQQMLSNAQAAIQDMANTAVSLISQLPGKFWTWFVNVVTKTVAWGQQMLSTATNAMNNMVSSIVSLVSTLPGRFWAWFMDVISKAAEWGRQMLSTATSAMDNMVSSIVSLVSTLPGRFLSWFTDVVAKAVAWGQQMVSNASSAASNFINTISNWISQLPGKMWGWLSDTLSRVAQFASDLASKASSAASGFVSNIVGGLSGLPGQMASIGSNIVSGIWNGISSGWGWLKDKVSSLANSLLDAAKGALGINSPSKKFRDEFGRWLMPGTVEGVKESMPKALREMEAQAGELLAAMQGTVDASMNEVSLNASSFGDAKALNNGGTTVYNDNHQEQENNYHVPVATPAETAKAQREAFRKMAGGVK